MKIGAYEFEAPKLPSNNYYVYFDLTTGEVFKITNEFVKDEQPGVSYITEDYRTVRDVLEGSMPLNSQKVIFDNKLKSYELKDKYTEDDFFRNEPLIYELVKQEGSNIKVLEDLKHTCWKFFIDEDFKIMLIQKGASLRTTLSFSITEKHNPNILYKTLQIPFKELFDQNYYILPFTSDFEFDGKDISVYTMKQFDSYSFEVINE